MIKEDSGTLVLAGTNSFTGSTTVSGGTLNLTGSLPNTTALTVASGALFDTSNDETVGSIAGAGTIDIEHKTQLTVGGDNTSTTFSGVLRSNSGSGTGGITKQGTGTLTLSGTNTFSGAISVTAGTVAVTSNNALGDTTNRTNISSGATLDLQNVNYSSTEQVNTSGTISTSTGTSTLAGNVILDGNSIVDVDGTQLTLSGVVSGSNDLTKTGDGIAILSATNTYTGDTTISAGTLRVSGSLNSYTDVSVSSGATYDIDASDTISSLSGAGTIDIANSQTLTAGNSNNTNVSGVIQGAGGYTKVGTGTQTLSGANTYTGTTAINGGVIKVTGSLSNSTAVNVGSSGQYNVEASDTIASIEGSGTIDIASSQVLTAGDSNNKTFSGVIQSAGGYTKAGSGIQTLSGANTYTGSTIINAGTLKVTGSLSDSTAVRLASGATYDVDATDTVGSLSGAGTVDIASSQVLTAGNSSNQTLSGVIQGDGGYTKAGSGTQTLSGTNTYTGATTINAGTLTVTGLLSNSTSVTVASGATYDVDASDTISSIAGAGTIDIANSQTLTAGNSANTEISGSIAGSGGFTKAGTGILTLSGTNSYNGTTTINAGTLKVTGSLSNSTAVNVGSSGTYDVDASDTIASFEGSGAIDIAASQILTAGDSNNKTFSGTMTGSGSLIKNGTGVLTLSGNNSFSGGSTLNAGIVEVGHNNALGSGTLTLAGGTLKSDSSTARDLSQAVSINADTTLGRSGSGRLTLSGDVTFSSGSVTVSSASNTIMSGAVDLGTGTKTFSVSSGLVQTASGVISNGSLTKSGAGRMNLTGDSTYTGTTLVSAGELRLQSGSSIDSTTVNVTGSGKLYLESANALASSANITLTGASAKLYVAENNTVNTVSGAGGIHIQSDNTLTVNNISSHTGKVKGQGDIVITGSHTIGAFIDTSDSTEDNINTRISGSGTTVTLGSSNVLPDDEDLTVENSATFELNSETDTVRDVNLTAGTIQGGTITATRNHNVKSGTVASNSVLAGSAALVKTTSDTVTLAGTNTYTGDTTVTTGALTVTGSIASSSNVTVNGGTLNLNNDDALKTTANVDVSSGTMNINNDTTVGDFGARSGSTTTIASGKVLTINPSTADKEVYGLAGSGELKKTGSTRTILKGSHSFTGDTRITGGTLQVASGASLNAATDVIVETGTSFDVDESITVASVTDSGDTDIASSKTLTVDHESSAGTMTYSGRLRGSGGFTKSGTGTYILRGQNDLSGDVTVSEGILYAGLAADNGTTIIANNVSVSGGTLGGGATIGGNVTSTGGTLAPGNSIGTLTIDGDLVLDSSSTTTIEFNTTSADKVVISGDITVDGALVLEPESGTYSDIQFTIFDGSGGSGNSLSGTFASTTVNNNSNLGGATTSISYDTINRKVFLDIGAAAASNTVKSLTTVSAFKDVAEIFDNATAGKILEVANVLKASDSASVNSELTKLEGSVLASSATQGIRNHGSYQKALNTATSFKSSSQVANFAKNNSSDLTLANLQSEGLFGEKRNWSDYFDYSDDTVLGFIKNNKNRSLLSDFKTDDKSSFIRTYGSETSRSNIGSTYVGYSSDTYGLLFGQQYQQNDNEFYGFSYGFTGTDTDYNNGNGESVNYTVHSSLFKQIDEEDYAMNIIGGGYVSKTESDRKVSVFGTSLDDVYKGETVDVGINGEIQYAKKFNFNGWSLAPSLAVSSIYEFRDDTDETGGELALKIDNENLFSLKPEVGISLDRDFSNKQNIKNQINLALFASQDHYLEGTTSKASYSTGSKFNVDIPRNKDTYLAAGLGYNFLNSESGTNLMANLFFTQNEEDDIEGSIVSLTFRKLFGDFGRGRIPPVIAEKVEEGKDKVVKIILPEPTVAEKQSIVDEYADEIRRELALLFQKESTKFKAYKDIYANFDCRVLENDFYKVLHLLGRAELTFLLEKCKFNEENKVILIANRLNEIDQRDLTLLDHLRISYFKLSVYTPFLTFIAFVILMYELVKKGAINIYTRRKKL